MVSMEIDVPPSLPVKKCKSDQNIIYSARGGGRVEANTLAYFKKKKLYKDRLHFNCM
jgi:hypothetical protein